MQNKNIHKHKLQMVYIGITLELIYIYLHSSYRLFRITLLKGCAEGVRSTPPFHRILQDYLSV